MNNRRFFLIIALGAGLNGAACPLLAHAQVAGVTPGNQQEDQRITALRIRIRAGAVGLKPGNVSQLIQESRITTTRATPASDTNPARPARPTKPKAIVKPLPLAPVPEPAFGAGRPNGTPALTEGGAPLTDPAAKVQGAAPAAAPPAQGHDAGNQPVAASQNFWATGNRSPGLPTGYHPVVRVQAPGRLDWTFVVSRQSTDPAPAAQMAGYNSMAQSYELYIPPSRNPRKPLGLILHISCAQKSDGWVYFEKICEKHGLALAGVHGAGNAIPDPWRARIVLDVLDDVRRRLPIDPDRTYITGGSGAGHEAGAIAHALPELFGGVIGMCGAWNLRAEQMLRQRMRERFSEAIVTGAADFNGPELRSEFFPGLRLQGIRSQLWSYADMGHSVPNPARLEQVVQWMEAGLPQRRAVGARFPASRLGQAVSPQEWSRAVLLEACLRTELPGGLISGLFELQAVADRWPGLPAAGTAQKLLAEFDASSPIPWKEIYRTERLEFRSVQAKLFDGTLSRQPPPGYPVPRINLLLIGISLWAEIHELAPAGSAASIEAANRLAALHREAGQ
jgi:hypothetical protein